MTPLARYLKRHRKLRAVDIGKLMKKYLRREPSSASLAYWVNGFCAPNARAQSAMYRATDEEVTPEAWHRWKIKRSRRNLK